MPGVAILLGAGGVQLNAVTNADGTFALSGVPSGFITMGAQLEGFASARHSFLFDQQPRQVDFVLAVGSISESVTVVAESRPVDQKARAMKDVVAPSQNVINLQRRTAGVLPVHVDVARAGTSHEFVKPLVVDQETAVTFRYTRR